MSAAARRARDRPATSWSPARFVLVGFSGGPGHLGGRAGERPAGRPLVHRRGRAAARVRAPPAASRRCCGRGCGRRFLLMAALDAGSLLAYFFAVRVLGVAVATFFHFLQPVWVALLAPRLLHAATERVGATRRWPSALAGLGVIVLRPSFSGAGAALGRRRRGGARLRRALRLLPDDGQDADAGASRASRGHRGVPARRALPPPARALAVFAWDDASPART